MEDDLHLPLTPSSPSLSSHLQALDLLSARLSTLPTRTRWSAEIPLNSKASVPGWLVHTNDVKVDIGGDWWVGMTAEGAREYVGRRKVALLEEHVRFREGLPRPGARVGDGVDRRAGTGAMPLMPMPEVQFDPFFLTPGQARASRRLANSRLPSITGRPPQSMRSEVSLEQPGTEAAEKEHELDVVGSFVDAQQDEARRARLAAPLGEPTAVFKDEGLPMQEIREAPDGTTLSELAPAVLQTTSVAVEERKTLATTQELVDDHGAEFGSEAAKARREALRKRIFNDSDSSDEETSIKSGRDADEAPSYAQSGADEEVLATPRLTGSTITSLRQQRDAQSLLPISHSPETSLDSPSTMPNLSRRGSSTAPPPGKSILKPPSRKKSVSFDESIPPPPESPERMSGSAADRLGFPRPGIEFEPRPVPVILTPRPNAKTPTADQGFAGFRRGFLTPPKSAGGPSPAQSSSVSASVQSPVSASALSLPRKPNLFSQRANAVASNSNSIAGPSESRRSPPAKSSPALPKMSQSTPMPSVKSAVMEKVPERIATPPRLRVQPTPRNASSARQIEAERSPLEDDAIDLPSEGRPDEEVDLSDDDDEAEESDEYELDDRLLAREIALDAHKRRAYSLRRNAEELSEEAEVRAYDRSLGLDPPGARSSHQSADTNSNEGGDEREAGVMLALPSIVSKDSNGRPAIVNPSPDDIRRYVRVGKLDNGNLVLAPGERGWSDTDDDTENEGRMEGRRRKREMKRRLMGDEGWGVKQKADGVDDPGLGKHVRDVGTTAGKDGRSNAEAGVEREGTGRAGRVGGGERGLPPKIGTTAAMREDSTTAKQSGEERVEVSKKVSRFKAARMDMQ